jgi:hypothetical protein
LNTLVIASAGEPTSAPARHRGYATTMSQRHFYKIVKSMIGVFDSLTGAP